MAVIVYPIDNLAAVLHRSEKTIRLSLNNLTEKDLIERMHQGIGRADYIYVKVSHENTKSAQSVGGNGLPATVVIHYRVVKM